MDLGIYLHIPFCQQKCLYCDFPSYANLESLYESYTEALCREIAAQGLLFSQNRFVSTIFIGGGTPTLLPDAHLLRIIREVKSNFSLNANVEFTIEANPGTITGERLLLLREAGINRISFGIQAFNDIILTSLGRIHTSKQAIEAVDFAATAGFSNISIDLMFDLPGQSIADWRHCLETAVQLPITHISAYGLKIEEGTAFATQAALGKLGLPDEDSQDEMYNLVTTFLPQQGYARYEISNYARPGFECRHNRKYWRNQRYLGLGAAAHSFLDGKRFANTANVRKYINSVLSENSALEYCEQLSTKDAMAEFCFLALRMTEGICFADFSATFRVPFAQVYGQQCDSLVDKGLLAKENERIYLTEKGMKYGNQVFCHFLL